jgi:formate/nitrite transporter
MPEFNIYSPKEISNRIISAGVAKGKMILLSLVMLGVLAGAFIGFGALFYTIIVSDNSLSYASARVIGGLCFSLGLVMVVIAGAELFTGNILITMAWVDGKVSLEQLLRNWIVAFISNTAGAAGLALLVFLSGSWAMNSGVIGQTYLKIAIEKSTTPFWELFFLGVLCNNLVCLAIWMSFAGRTVLDKCIAVIFPVTAFVHSIANLYYYSIAGLLKMNGHPLPNNAEFISIPGALHNLVPVIMGNVIGGSLLVAVIYWIIYRRKRPKLG